MGRPTTIRGAALAAAFGVLTLAAGAAPAGAGDAHADARFGYSIQPPKEWTEIPVKIEEGWLIAKYLSKKASIYNDKEGWTWEHKPEMSVIAFVAESAKQKDPAVEKEVDKAIAAFANRYKDYLDYLKKTYTGGGYYVSKEERVEVGGVAATAYEIKVEKQSYQGPKRMVAWVFHVPDVDIAVQFEVLEDSYDKLAPTLVRALRSFKQIPRQGALPSDQANAAPGFLTRLGEDQLSPDERRKRRVEQEMAAHKRAVDTLPEGWTQERIGRFLVLNHADDKYAKRLVEHGTAVLKWLDETFAFVGPEEYVRSPILRICKTQDEENSYHRGGGTWTWSDLEVVVNREQAQWTEWRVDTVGWRLIDLWFADRDQKLQWAMPFWLSNGLQQLVSNSEVKGGKLAFRSSDEWTNDELRAMVRDGRALKPRELVMLAQADVFEASGNTYWDQWRQSQAFVHFLLAGAGSRDPDLRATVPEYLRNLHRIVDEREQAEKNGADKAAAPKTEEEEERLFQERQAGWKKREKEVLEDVFRRTFGGWDEVRWKRVDKAYFKAIG